MNRFIACRLLLALIAFHLCAAIAGAEDTAPKVAPPDAGTRVQDMKMVDDVYKAQIANAHTQAEKTALATEFIRLAGESKEKTAEQFALYSRAAEIAAQAGDAVTALAAIDILCRRFEVDSLAMHAEMLGKLANAVKQVSEQKAFIENCDVAMDDAVIQERYDLVKRIGDLEVSVARKYGDAASLKSANARISETHAARIMFDKQKTAVVALSKNPADPAANLVVGSYQCFIRDDWTNGLALLAKGSDAALKTLAGQDLAAAGDAKVKTALADGWWDRAGKERGLAQKHIQHHAAMLYTDALPSLTGLAKTIAEKRGAALTAATGFNARGMTLSEVLTRFTFPNKTFHLNGDAITGTAGDCDHPDEYVWLTTPETMQSFEFGFAIKASTHQMAVVDVDGHVYEYSHGHWANSASVIKIMGKMEERLPGVIKKPNDWASLKVVVAQNKMNFFYNGELAATCDLLTPMTSASKVRVGFASHHREMSIKDVYLVAK